MTFQDFFLEWMQKEEDKSPNTANAYLSGVRQIQKHHNKVSGENLDFFDIGKGEVVKLKSIEKEYDYGGKFSDIGNSGKRTYINGLATYIRFLDSWFSDEHQNLHSTQLLSKPLIEVDSLRILFLQKASVLFPNHSVNTEYSKGNSIVLETAQKNGVIVIELIAGTAKSDSFGHISATMGELGEIFPAKNITGIVIASDFDKTLVAAVKTNANISLKTFVLDLSIKDQDRTF